VQRLRSESCSFFPLRSPSFLNVVRSLLQCWTFLPSIVAVPPSVISLLSALLITTSFLLALNFAKHGKRESEEAGIREREEK
jgi:hypothetical protein